MIAPRLFRFGQSRALSDALRHSSNFPIFRYREPYLHPTHLGLESRQLNTMTATAPQIEQVPIEDFDKVFTASYIGKFSTLDYRSGLTASPIRFGLLRSRRQNRSIFGRILRLRFKFNKPSTSHTTSKYFHREWCLVRWLGNETT